MRIMDALHEVIRTIRPFRRGLASTSAPEPDHSVNVMLLHLYDSAEQAAYGAAMLIGHGAFVATFLITRPCFEYMIRALYCAENPDYAQWCVHLQVLRSQLRHHDSLLSDREKRRLGDEIRRQERRFPDFAPHVREAQNLTPFHRITFADMVDEVLSERDQENYRLQSMLMHGDPFAVTVVNDASDQTVNRMFLHVAEYLTIFGRLLRSRQERIAIFDDEFERVVGRVDELSQRYDSRHGKTAGNDEVA
jgi:hypothetical protein